MSKYIELAKKLKALADRGIGGEKVNAEKMLNALMKKHKKSIEDIEGEKQEDYYLKIDSTHIKIFNQIAKKVNRSVKVYGEFPKNIIRKHRLKGNYMITCSPAEYVEIEAKYDFYSKLYKDEFDIFFTSFLKANSLLLDNLSTEEKELTKEEYEKWKRISEMAGAIKVGHFMKQIK